MITDSLDELELYVNLLEAQNQLKYKDFKALVKDLQYEFNIIVTEEQVRALYYPTLEEEVIDLRMIYDRL